MRRDIIVPLVTTAMVATGAAACGTSGTGVPALPRATCGGAVTHGVTASTQFLSADRDALACFAAAARACKAASLAITAMGVDTGTSYVFAVQPGGKPAACQVTELAQSYSANFGGSTGTITTTQCQETALSSAGVTLACTGQPVLIPATVTSLS